jgi:hypothetical protein
MVTTTTQVPRGLEPTNLEEYASANRLDRLFDTTAQAPSWGPCENVDPSNRTPFPPELADLVRLHKLVRERRVTTVLEFGVGWSTFVMADALVRNRRDFADHVRANLRRSNPFEIHCIDDDREFIETTSRRLPAELSDLAFMHHSECEMGTFNSRICTFYGTIPNVCPDFVYLDGPSQFSVRGDVRGVSTRHMDRLPMAGDILAMEHFFLPGTLVLVDGRTANARFLRANLQRGWRYSHIEASDVHVFELAEPPLGELNRKQIEFCLGAEWLAGVRDQAQGC